MVVRAIVEIIKKRKISTVTLGIELGPSGLVNLLR